MRLIIDNIIFYWQRSGGISVVWAELIKRLLNDKIKVSFINYDGVNANHFYNLLKIPDDLILEKERNCGMWLKRYFPVMVKVKDPFVFHSTYYRICKNKNAINVVTVHDFTYEYFGRGLSKLIHYKTKWSAIKKADYIICISENTKKDLIKFIPSVAADKIKVIYNGVGQSFRQLDVHNRYNDDTVKYLLFVGGRDGYKNFKLAVEVSKMSKMKLYIVGKHLSQVELSDVKRALGDNYIDFGFVDDEKLNELYNKAFALIYPSSYEGFGIPVIEAQKAGCPVLALNKSSIPEVIGDKSMLVNYENAALFNEKIELLKNDRIRENVISNGLMNSRRFSWDKTYLEYMGLYKTISRVSL